MELDFLLWLQSNHSAVLDAFFGVYTRLGDHGELWIFLSVILMISKRTRKVGVLAIAALLIEFISVEFMIKPLIMRPRPFQVHPMNLLIDAPRGSSFPSGHTASSFAVAGVFYFNKIKGKELALLLATLMGVSRLYLFVHYPSDVIIGCLWGLTIAYILTHFYHKVYQTQELKEQLS